MVPDLQLEVLRVLQHRDRVAWQGGVRLNWAPSSHLGEKCKKQECCKSRLTSQLFCVDDLVSLIHLPVLTPWLLIAYRVLVLLQSLFLLQDDIVWSHSEHLPLRWFVVMNTFVGTKNEFSISGAKSSFLVRSQNLL